MKFLEVRDRGTYIPALAISPREIERAAIFGNALSEPLRCLTIAHGLNRAGLAGASLAIVIRLDRVEAHSSPAEWSNAPGRTMRLAHSFIERDYEDLRSGDVVDVEFLSGETKTKKEPEAAFYGGSDGRAGPLG